MGPLAASWEAFEASWQPLGASWRPLGTAWRPRRGLLAPLGASWRPLGNLLGPLGGVLAPLGGLLGASWGGLRPILVPLERSLAHLGVVLKSFGWKSSPGCSGSTILGAPRWSPWRGNGPGSSGSRIFRGPPGGRTGSAEVQRRRSPTVRGTLRPPKALAKAKATTIMSLLAN